MSKPWAHWDSVERLVLAQPAGKDLHLIKQALPHPTEAEMQPHFGIPKGGSFKHFRRSVRGTSCLHVREYADHYQIHWDRRDPRITPMAHWWTDVRGGKATLVAGAMSLLASPLLLFV